MDPPEMAEHLPHWRHVRDRLNGQGVGLTAGQEVGCQPTHKGPLGLKRVQIGCHHPALCSFGGSVRAKRNTWDIYGLSASSVRTAP